LEPIIDELQKSQVRRCRNSREAETPVTAVYTKQS